MKIARAVRTIDDGWSDQGSMPALDARGAGTPTTGFPSRGEVSPFTPGARCALHDRPITVTTLSDP